ncbi:ribosome biogenesis protein C1orf109 homolog [Acanthochromis polyacanthus]|uniref:AFG2 interacting ribosome maturation factor n=1 Tax=Acanthochromis polyacanthus TaxID=80966 RepID=A0A3Q1FPZ7_9TELE|nr:ribosome biogenesis protein C1orf109 homolog [Acanthochromis polyacanthus]XP_051805393.1 ribosome biogenesis protein C1orf109 homolog [Acanthochromis polyacanthus]
MSKPAVFSLDQALRRSFVNLEDSQKVWRKVLEDCNPLMESLGNLAEQSAALSGLQISNTPLRDFPDLEERLRFKLSLETDSVLRKLHENMSSLQAVRDSVSHHLSAVQQQFDQISESLDLLDLTQRSASTPSVCDLMEWLQDAERLYRLQFLRRKTLLQTLRVDDFCLLESAPQRWKSVECESSEDQITETLCRVSFFMESQ